MSIDIFIRSSITVFYGIAFLLPTFLTLAIHNRHFKWG